MAPNNSLPFSLGHGNRLPLDKAKDNRVNEGRGMNRWKMIDFVGCFCSEYLAYSLALMTKISR